MSNRTDTHTPGLDPAVLQFSAPHLRDVGALGYRATLSQFSGAVEFGHELARRWNAHAGLVAALRTLLDRYTFHEQDEAQARSALAALEPK